MKGIVIMKKKICYFNLIEILLTVAVIAFGVVVILGMLPKGLRASRNAATVSYASEVIEQMGYYLQQQGVASGVKKGKYDNDVVDKPEILRDYSLLAKENASVSGFTATGINGVYKYDDSTYVIVIGNTEEIDGETVNNVIFSGMLRICTAESDNFRLAAKHNHGDSVGCFAGSSVCGSKPVQSSSDMGDFEISNDAKVSTVYMELSYPLSVEYSARSKIWNPFF